MDFGKYSLKNIKSCRGRDGDAWSATLYRDGVKIGDISQSGSGGPTNIYFFAKGEEAVLKAHATAQPPIPNPYGGADFPCDSEWFVEELRAWTQATTKARSALKNKIVEIVAGKRGVAVWNMPYTPANVAKLAAKGVTVVDPSAPDALERVARAMIVD